MLKILERDPKDKMLSCGDGILASPRPTVCLMILFKDDVCGFAE